MIPNDPRLKVNSVVQLNPEEHLGEKNGFFAGCFMVVSEMKGFGAQGYIASPGKRGEMPGSAYYRAKWEEMEYIGEAQWALPTDDDEPEKSA